MKRGKIRTNFSISVRAGTDFETPMTGPCLEKDKKYQHLLPSKSAESPLEKKKRRKKNEKKKKVAMLPDNRVNHWSMDDAVDGSVDIHIDPSCHCVQRKWLNNSNNQPVVLVVGLFQSQVGQSLRRDLKKFP